MKDIVDRLKRAPSEPKADDKRRTKYRDEYAEIAAKLIACGFSQKDLSWTFGVNPTTIRAWIKSQPDFAHAVENGKRVAKQHLVAAAFRQAMGYDYKEKNTKKVKDVKTGEIVKEETSEFERQVLPNGQMLIFLLCNIDRQLDDNEWKSIKQIEVKRDENVHVQIDGELATDHIKKLAGKLFDEQPRKYIESRVVEGVGNAERADSNTPAETAAG